MSKRKAVVADQKRIFLVDDHPIVREGLATLIQQEPDLTVCGEVESFDDALAKAQGARPDLAIVDLGLKSDRNGFDLCHDLLAQMPQLPVLVLSMHDESMYAERALKAGARGYIMKEVAHTNIIDAIRTVLSGAVYLSPALSQRLLNRVAGNSARKGGSPQDLLSERELEVFRMIGQGMPTRDIAQTLKRSIKTVEAHRENIKRKLQLPDATALLQQAIRWIQSEAG